MSRLVHRTLVALVALVAVLAPAGVATAAVSRASVLFSWTQTSVASYDSWNAARGDQGAWASYGFTWSTDYCSFSPDNPLGFTFSTACWRHDFGYRNYRAVGAFPANKARLDSAFHEDLKRRCATYGSAVRPACNSLAWTYYHAVRVFGSLAAVRPNDIDRARALIR